MQHLRASRHFADIVLDNAKRYGAKCILAGLVIEQYAYFELCSILQLPPNEEHFDIFRDSPVLQLDNLRSFEAFGALFGCGSSLYQLIPSISQLAIARRAEVLEDVNLKCEDEYNRLTDRLNGWSPTSDKAKSVEATEECILAGRVTQIAVQLFLYSAYYLAGKMEQHDLEYVRRMAHPLVEEALEIASKTWRTSWTNTNYWFIIIIASYAIGDEQQQSCLVAVSSDWPLTRAMRRCLEWMWQRPEELYGLEGLTKAQQELRIRVLVG